MRSVIIFGVMKTSSSVLFTVRFRVRKRAPTYGTSPSTGIRDSDTFAVFPLGVGIAYRVSGFVLDARGTLRLASDSNLIVSNTTTGAFASMHTWEASAGAGYEF